MYSSATISADLRHCVEDILQHIVLPPMLTKLCTQAYVHVQHVHYVHLLDVTREGHVQEDLL